MDLPRPGGWDAAFGNREQRHNRILEAQVPARMPAKREAGENPARSRRCEGETAPKVTGSIREDRGERFFTSTIPSQKTCLGRRRQPPTDDREGVPAFHAFFRVSGRSSTLDVEERFLSGRPGFSHGLRTRKCHGEIGRLSCS